ncbi:MAG: c-type cytochrome [Actinomycetota bacterium]
MNGARTGAALFAALMLAACGGSGPTASPKDSLVQQGEALRRQKACASCHSIDGSGGVGPTWKGLAGSPVELDDGTTVPADEAYLRESMLDPSAKTVKGFRRGLMETVIKPNTLPDDEVRALVAYIQSLK